MGRRVWHNGPIVSAAFTVMAVGCAVLVNLPSDPKDPITLPSRLGFTVIPLAALWILILRPRVALVEDDIAVVQWRRTVRFPAQLLVGVAHDYYGTDLRLSDGRVVRTEMLQRPNVAAWTGYRSRAERISHELLCHAATLRGEDLPSPPGSRRSRGDLSGGALAAIGAAIAAIFNSLN